MKTNKLLITLTLLLLMLGCGMSSAKQEKTTDTAILYDKTQNPETITYQTEHSAITEDWTCQDGTGVRYIPLL